ncbi:substrate-binding domain-containing protein, partial [Chamaesiphon sp. OTE_8_metabat_110]|uniref:substrate-binding domain-containing protein n=1 Tax=Chamaesiphon sp. OTE_8_metabat_110 TaxID=2964696 RepID=UPI00286C7FF3
MNAAKTSSAAIALYAILSLGAMPIFANSAVAQVATDATSTAPTTNTVRIEGSSSMKVTNNNRIAQIKQSSPDAQITTRYNGADAALKSVLDGTADLAAIGRPLTEREQQQGLVAVPQKRQKIAIIVGAANRFTSNLTFEQFAKIFRGEIKDWSELGAPPGRIQLVDRPDTNDTRLALQNYAVFKQAPFVATPNAIKVADDTIESAIEQLGSRGITYTVSDAIDNIPGIRIVPMHKTLPRDPRYPFSQPLAYVYKAGTPRPAVAAFLGGTAAAASIPEAAPAPVETTSTTTVTRSTTENDFPWLLLLFPLLGGLLWW